MQEEHFYTLAKNHIHLEEINIETALANEYWHFHSKILIFKLQMKFTCYAGGTFLHIS